jgi:diaminopimelate epimerase
MHGIGNDFVVVETNGKERNWSQLAVAMCDRHYGIGADGLLLFMPSAVADFRMRIFNADGSEANTCGNGIRCLVKYFLDSRSVKKTNDKVTVETLTGIGEAHAHRIDHKVTGITIGMGKPTSVRQDIPIVLAQPAGNVVDIISSIQYELSLDGTVLSLDLVSIGNPHAVYFTEEPVSKYALSKIGPEVERQFSPLGMNFEIARIISDHLIEMRVWEHGVGETLACGSGACATTVAARIHSFIGNKVTIHLPGGELEVAWDGIGEVYLSGPAKTVYLGEWPDTVNVKGRVVDIKNEVLA